MARGYVGVDIGASAVRVAGVDGVTSEGMALVSRVGIEPLPRGAVVAGRVRDEKTVASALLKALKQAGVSRQGFVLGIASPDSALTARDVPLGMRRSERIPALRLSGASIAPTFDITESALSAYMAGQNVNRDGITLSTIGVAAVRQTDLSSLAAVCERARCTPKAIDLSGAALLRSFVRVGSAPAVGMLVDIGATQTTVIAREGMHMRSLRTTVGGGDDLTQSYANGSGLAFDEAETAKALISLPVTRIGGGGGGYIEEGSGDPGEEQLSKATDLLVDAIAQSIESDANNFGSAPQQIALCGSGALLRGLKGRLRVRTGIPTKIARPWLELEWSKRNAEHFSEGRADPLALLSLGTAAGLALWKDPL